MIAKQKFFILIAVVIGLYAVSTGLSYLVFRGLRAEGNGIDTPLSFQLPGSKLKRSEEPRTEPCPLNGRLHTKKERQAWEKRRPLGIMIENHLDSRPQFGLSLADIVYEAVSEGGITRFLAVYYCDGGDQEIKIGPVRSARTYFLDWISEYGVSPLYAHVGGANCDPETGSGCQNGAKADALGQIRAYGWDGYNDMNQFSIGFPTFWRDYSRGVATEHTMFSNLQKLWDVGKKRGLAAKDKDGVAWDETFEPWTFVEKGDMVANVASQSATFNFWDGYPDFEVTWTYDPEKNTYVRTMGGTPHVDALTDEVIEASTVILQFQTEAPANDGYPGNVHLLYGTIGTGDAMILQGGSVINGSWAKKNREARTVFTGAGGQEVALYPGKIWIETLPLGNAVTIQ